jgi:hypothetical protein
MAMGSMRKLQMAALAAAAVLPLGMASPTSTATTEDACTVTPERPVVLDEHDAAGRKIARFDIRINCKGDRSVFVQQELWEQDNGKPGDVGDDDFIKRINYKEMKFVSGGTGLWRRDQSAYLLDAPDRTVELYQKVRFTVVSNRVDGGQTAWERSPIRMVIT